MYYYIMEPASKKIANWQDKVKDVLGDLGIAGETVLPSPARNVEELANLGIVKGYSTIVAVGSENLVNKVVSAVINQKNGKEVVIGIIPDNFDGRLAKRIGVTDLKDACNALKFRKLETIDACLIEPNKYFMTECIIETGIPGDCYLTLDQVQAGLPFNKIKIEPGLKINIYDESKSFLSGKKFFNWIFGKKDKDIFSSFFQSNRLKIETPKKAFSVKVDGEVIAKTPIICQNKPKVLKLIIKRDMIAPKE